MVMGRSKRACGGYHSVGSVTVIREVLNVLKMNVS